ncbi:MAG TPA: hypothetical protein VFE07_05995, partial [Marmoricola sp.]|nr:hypothetical protein [Marmoricola sp.]
MNEPNLVAVRRNVWLSGVVAGLAALIGIAYLLRGSGLGILVGVVLLVVAALNALGVSAARTPVLVADQHGIRLRVGLTWRGLPWGAIRQVVVEHADHPLREGRLVVVPRDPGSTTDHLGTVGRLHLLWNELWFGAALSIPLGMTTLTDSSDLGTDLAALADGRTDVVQLRGRQRAQLDDVPAPERPAEPVVPVDEPWDKSWDEVSDEPWDEPPPPPADELLPEDEPAEELPAPVAPLRALHHPARVEVRLDTPAMSGRDQDEPTSSGLVPAQRLPEEVEHTAEVPDL